MIVEQLNKEVKNQTFAKAKASEKPIRSFVKAISWRVVGTLDTLLVSYLVTGKFGIASAIASVDFLTKMVLYFFHERIWNTIKWGK